MTRFHTFAVALYASFAAASAFGQSASWPPADVIARADRYGKSYGANPEALGLRVENLKP